METTSQPEPQSNDLSIKNKMSAREVILVALGVILAILVIIVVFLSAFQDNDETIGTRTDQPLVTANNPTTTPPSSSEPSEMTTAPNTNRSDILFSVAHSGGDCPTAQCSSFVLYRSGAWEQRLLGFEQRVETGSLSSEELLEVTKLIDTLDTQAVRNTPFTGVCPSAYDGIESQYNLYPDTGTEKGETYSSCVNDLSKFPVFAVLTDIAQLNGSTSEVTEPTLPSVKDLSVGDTLGAFTVTGIEIHDYVFFDGSQDFTVTFSGDTTISGTAYVAMGAICIKPIPSDLSKIPAIQEMSSQEVCFIDDVLADQALDVTQTKNEECTVRIKDFSFRYAHKGGPGTIATFVKKL